MVARFQRMGSRPIERWTLALFSGLLNGAAFIDFGSLSLIANVPLLLALRRSSSATESAGLGGIVGLLGGLHIYGIVNYGWFLLIGFGLYTASQMVIFGLLFRALWNRGRPFLDLLLPAAIWAFTEWIRTIGPLCMPASYVGNIADVSVLKPWLWLAPMIGGLGVSTLVALFGSLLSCFHRSRRSSEMSRVVERCLDGSRDGQCSWQPLMMACRTVAAVQSGLANSHYDAALVDHAAKNVVRTFEHLNRRAFAVIQQFCNEDTIRAHARQKRCFSIVWRASSEGHLAGVVETVLPADVIMQWPPFISGRVGDLCRKIRLLRSKVI